MAWDITQVGDSPLYVSDCDCDHDYECKLWGDEE